MQAPRSRQFVMDHMLFSATIYGAMVAILAIGITLTLTGDLTVPEQGSDADVASAAFNLPQDRIGIGAGKAQQWAVGDVSSPSLDRGRVGSDDRSLDQVHAPLRELDRSSYLATLRSITDTDQLSLSDLLDLEVNLDPGYMKP